MGKDVIKVIFGVAIFLFSVALGYFTASYFENLKVLDYSNTLLLFGGAYLLVGIVVARVFPVSLGFLFAADLFILHVLSSEYRGYHNLIKVFITGGILLALYGFAWWKFKDEVIAVPLPPKAL